MSTTPARTEAASVAPALVARTLGRGRGWHADECVCTAGPGERVFEERHDSFSVAAVLDGTFNYRSDHGAALMHPGSLLLGNFGRCYECGHDHSTGDRCVAFHFEPEYFAEVAATEAGTSRFTFPTSRLPATPALLPWIAAIDAHVANADALESDELAWQVLRHAIAALSGGGSRPLARISALDQRRISESIRYIELHAGADLDLGRLAAIASMRSDHFLRTFRRVAGCTPYQFLLGVRMRRVAQSLLSSAAPIATIAMDAGFGDLSTFNARFRAQFGMSPRQYRLRGPRR